jgi:predicted aldo/keto reductase-like oxidoreductase
VGVVAMKTLMGARLNDLRPYETHAATFAQAALRWTLSQPDTDALVVTMTSREQVDEYLGASGFTRPRGADRGLLRAYLAANGASHCRQGCDACEDSCPHGVAVSDVLRSRMYAEDYGDARLARESYAQLGAGASACLACDGSPCAGACPFGLPVGALTRRTQRLLGRRPSENGASGRRESA